MIHGYVVCHHYRYLIYTKIIKTVKLICSAHILSCLIVFIQISLQMLCVSEVYVLSFFCIQGINILSKYLLTAVLKLPRIYEGEGLYAIFLNINL